MATFYSRETTPLNLSPPQRINDVAQRGKVFVIRATIDLSASLIDGSLVLLGKRPAGSRFAYGLLCTDTSLGSTTFGIGIVGTVAKYRADAVFTATNTPTLFGLVSAMDDIPLTADEDVYMDINTATAPSSGVLIIDMYYIQQ